MLKQENRSNLKIINSVKQKQAKRKLKREQMIYFSVGEEAYTVRIRILVTILVVYLERAMILRFLCYHQYNNYIGREAVFYPAM